MDGEDLHAASDGNGGRLGRERHASANAFQSRTSMTAWTPRAASRTRPFGSRSWKRH